MHSRNKMYSRNKNNNNNNKLITRTSKNKKTKKTIKIISKPKIISNKTLSGITSNDDITIKFMSKRFYTKTKTARRLIREPLVKDKFGQFLDDNYKKLKKGNILKENELNRWIFDELDENCICKNIFKKELPEDCKCYDMEKYKQQGKSGAIIYKLTCSQQPRSWCLHMDRYKP